MVYMYVQVGSYLLNTKVFTRYDSLHARSEFCGLPIAFLQTVWTQMKTNRTSVWSGSKLLDSPMSVLGGLFVITEFWRKSADENKNMKYSLACK